MAGWLRACGALAGWAARFLEPVGWTGTLGGRFLTCEDQLPVRREAQPVFAATVLDHDHALPLQQRGARDSARRPELRVCRNGLSTRRARLGCCSILHANENTSHLR